ncbi:MAG TPA: acyl-ACP--UDP-N-acetylglucosamine O-acyltransferase [Planctomycetaceae bacterium]|nr:acyl-ACP--UDP-N-acetylglucosamine O-acyltransferase [Planctomycetaceae bacterium]
MPTRISPLAEVDPRAELADDVEIGPYCVVGPHATIGADTTLSSHVSITGHTRIGRRNRFFPGAVIGAPPQDVSFGDAETYVEIGDDNQFREGVTVNCGAEKEDFTTRIGNGNLLMINSHVAHNCRVFDNVILVNGVLLGGHVHVHDGAIVSGNSVVHHFSTLGTLSFVSGGCRVPHDVPPYMLAAGSDDPTIRTINLVGLQRRGVPHETIRILKRAHRLVFREHKKLEAVRAAFEAELPGPWPAELTALLEFLERQQQGRMGRAREVFRNVQAPPSACGDERPVSRRAA